MSRTEMYFLKDNDYSMEEFKNAWRGAMYVWQDVAKRYCKMERFPMGIMDGDEEKMSEVWNFDSRHPGEMAEHDAIVMLSTMDNVLLEPSQWERVANAFEKYSEAHPDSSLGEQAQALRSVMESEEGKEVVAIGWCQTSVCGDVWTDFNEDDDTIVYDPTTGDKHWWMIEQYDELHSPKDAPEPAC